MWRPCSASSLTTYEVMENIGKYGCYKAVVVPVGDLWFVDFAFAYPLCPMRYNNAFETAEQAIGWWKWNCHDYPALGEVQLYVGCSTWWQYLRERNQEVALS